MIDVRAIETVDVFRDDLKVGALSRTRLGSIFEYDAAFLSSLEGREGGVAVHLPYAQRRFETFGVNLHPFFAGLLPEGLRLEAVVSRVKTSADDLLSILIASGADCVGDVAVIAAGESIAAGMEEARAPLEEVLFADLFERSLARAGEPGVEPTIPGVQEKVSASMISFPVHIAGRREAHFLKLNPPGKPRLVENEAFFMSMAQACGMETAKVKLVYDRERNPGLLVTRFDRKWSRELRRLVRIHQEDACQFLDRYPAEKYRLSCREIAEGLSVCAAPIPETARLIRLIAFSYLIGNGDLHGKNVSVAALGPRAELRLTPAYDLLSTFPYGDRHMALKLEGRDDGLTGRYFLAFGARLGVKEPAVQKLLEDLYERSEPWIERIGEIGLAERKTEDLRRLMRKRREELTEFG
ncbi:MAG: HipA domain-containing protein [Myxococcales bacterium]|nr:HipA domain-containing protein [Myxococcales bacterium]